MLGKYITNVGLCNSSKNENQHDQSTQKSHDKKKKKQGDQREKPGQHGGEGLVGSGDFK